MTTSNNPERSHAEGVAAAQAGADITTSNPYVPGTDDFDTFIAGFNSVEGKVEAEVATIAHEIVDEAKTIGGEIKDEALKLVHSVEGEVAKLVEEVKGE